MTMARNADGKLYTQHQVEDYAKWGIEFKKMGFLTFTVEMYECRMAQEDENVDNGRGNRLGCRTNLHSHYLDDHPKKETHYRVGRSDHHNTLPNIIGAWPPR